MSAIILEQSIRRAAKRFFNKHHQRPTILRINPKVLKSLLTAPDKCFKPSKSDPKLFVGLRIVEDAGVHSYEITNREPDQSS